MRLARTVVATPIGPLALYAHEGALVTVAFDGAHGPGTAHERRLTRALGAFTCSEVADAAGAATRLAAYFAGEREALGDQPLRALGTPFQSRVWQALRAIPVGATTSYARLAERLGQPRAVRAVAAANAANPLPVFVPCHRVVAADGSLWGYAGGLERKRALLAHEGAIAPAPARLPL
ncbi:MAG: methylated-DNA--[protein]-cysteine S-methyltransferase [bacterium]